MKNIFLIPYEHLVFAGGAGNEKIWGRWRLDMGGGSAIHRLLRPCRDLKVS